MQELLVAFAAMERVLAEEKARADSAELALVQEKMRADSALEQVVQQQVKSSYLPVEMAALSEHVILLGTCIVPLIFRD